MINETRAVFSLVIVLIIGVGTVSADVDGTNSLYYYQCLETGISGTAAVTIISQIQGYKVYVDEIYINTEGRTEPRDGWITVHVDGGLLHTIKIVKNGYSKENTSYYEPDKSYVINF